MTTVMTTDNAGDYVLLVDNDGQVVSRWNVDPEVLASYLKDGANANQWEKNEWPSVLFDPEMQDDDKVAAELRTIEAYGVVVGNNGEITDSARRQYWGLEALGIS